MITPQAALVYTMVVAAEADHDIAETEIELIGDLVNHLPVFRGVRREQVVEMATACSELLSKPGGIDQVFDEVRAALSDHLRETAYALACDVIAVDTRLHGNEMKVLEDIRNHLGVDHGVAGVIERSARVRFQAA